MRDIGEHIDAYAIDHPKRHAKTVAKTVVHRQLEVGWWDGTTFSWFSTNPTASRANSTSISRSGLPSNCFKRYRER
jgi:hypothetical protein